MYTAPGAGRIARADALLIAFSSFARNTVALYLTACVRAEQPDPDFSKNSATGSPPSSINAEVIVAGAAPQAAPAHTAGSAGLAGQSVSRVRA